MNSIPELNNVDVILADSVFEHLPNSSLVIQGIINALAPGGVLIENYSGHSLSAPHKSDTLNSYKLRDNNMDMLCNQLSLLHGKIPKKKDGIYDYDSSIKAAKEHVAGSKSIETGGFRHNPA